MVTIHKKVLDFSQADIVPVSIPFGAEVMHIGSQYNATTMWYLCDTEEKEVEVRKFQAFATGQEIPEDLIADYIGTSITLDGIFVLHIFEIYE